MKKIFTLLLLIVSYMGFAQATLPVSTTSIGRATLPLGFSQSGLGTDYSSPTKLKFDTAGDFLVLNFDSAPGNLSFSIGENNNFGNTLSFASGSTFTIQESDNGSSYTDVVSYTSADKYGNKTITNLKSTSRYVRWFYTAKASGYNVSLYNIVLAKASASETPSLSLSTSSLSFGNVYTSTTSSASTVTVTGANLTSAPTYNITGTDAAMFSASGTLTTSGGNLSVTFTPTSVGAKSATLTVTSGALSSTVTLSGTGLSADNPFGLVETSPVVALLEDFESGTVNSTTMPTDWKSANETTSDKNWTIKSFSNNKYAEMTAYSGTGTYNSWLISPAINLDKINKTNVQFDWNSGFANGALLKVYVLKLNNGVMSKNLIKTINDTTNTTGYGSAFTTETIDVSAYSGIGFLAFEYVGTAGSTTTTYQIDKVTISTSLGIKDLNKTKNIFLKNTMVDNTLSFQTKGNASVKVYNANGQLVKSAIISAQNANVNVANLPKGNYVVTAELNGETVSQKILKK